MHLKLERCTMATQRTMLTVIIEGTPVRIGNQCDLETPGGHMQIKFQENGVWYFQKGEWHFESGFYFDAAQTPLASIAECLRSQFRTAYKAFNEKNIEKWEGSLD